MHERNDGTALEPDPAEMRALLGAVSERLIDYVEGLRTGPALDEFDHEELRSLVDEPLPEHGQPTSRILDLLFDRLIPAGVNPASPGSLSYVNGGGLVHAAIAGLIASVTNRYGGFWAAAPGLNAIEETVVRWICDLAGFPASAGGLLLTGGSMANLTAIVTARHERLVAPLSRGTLYASAEMHHSIRKAALVAGLPPENVRAIPTDDRQRVRLDLMEAQIEEDRAQGLVPFCLVGTAGSTTTGAVDDLDALASIAQRHGLWYHVDAAYGGFFMLTRRGRIALSGIARADSATLDPHKSLFLPFGTGSLIVRDVDALRRAHTLHSSCVAAIARLGEECGGVNFADLSVEQTRETRGLRVWLPLKILGATAFRDALDEKLDLAALAADRVRSLPGLEILAAPALSTFAFRLADVPPGQEAEATRRLVDAVNRYGDVHLAMAEVDGRPVVRVCVLSFRTHRPTVEVFATQLAAAVEAASSMPVAAMGGAR